MLINSMNCKGRTWTQQTRFSSAALIRVDWTQMTDKIREVLNRRARRNPPVELCTHWGSLESG